MSTLNVFVDCGDIIDKTVKHVIPTLFTDVKPVEIQEEADIIIADSPRKIGGDYSQEKYYAVMGGTCLEEADNFPANVRPITVGQFVAEFAALLSEIRSQEQKKEPIPVPEPLEVAVEVGEKVEILVIDDLMANRQSAIDQMSDHYDVITASSYNEAMELLGKKEFYIVLSDLNLPMSPKNLSDKTFKLGEQVPYGLLLAIEAIRQGANYVAVVTDIDHHSDAISAAFDHFAGKVIKMGNAKLTFVQQSGGVKNWLLALNKFS